MNLSSYKTTFFSKETLLLQCSSFLQASGVCALLLGVGDVLYPNTFHYGLSGLEVIVGLSALWSIYRIWPRFEVARQMTVPDTKITIKIGDIFNQEGSIVIGFTDVFDTEKGEIISPNSIQGQFLSKVYGDDRAKLDTDIKNALRGKLAQIDKKKTRGKNMRYPVGTIATLTNGGKKYFCVAYSYMGKDLKAQSDVTKLTISLYKLWEEVRVKGERNNLVMGVLGSDLARIGHVASSSNLIKLIVSSFILASREAIIAKELTLIIKDNNLGKINMLELNGFLQGF